VIALYLHNKIATKNATVDEYKSSSGLNGHLPQQQQPKNQTLLLWFS